MIVLPSRATISRLEIAHEASTGKILSWPWFNQYGNKVLVGLELDALRGPPADFKDVLLVGGLRV
jgi:hypothetical protein